MPDRKYKVYKTAVFKLHNPSRRRRAALTDIMKRVDRAYWKAIRAVEQDVKALAGLSKQERREDIKAIYKRVNALMKPLPLPLSTKNEVMARAIQAQVQSYLELLETGQEAEWPVEGDEHDPFYLGLEKLTQTLHPTGEEYNAARDLLLTRPKRKEPRPLNFERSNFKNGVLLLADDKNRLFVWMNLYPQDSRYAHKVVIKDMVNTRTGALVSRRSTTGDLFPLACGKWHYEAFIRRGRLQSAKLIKRDDDFFLAGTFEFESDYRETDTYLGIDRGIDNLAAYAVVDENGTTRKHGRIEGTTLRDYQKKKEALFARQQRLRGTSRLRWGNFGTHVIHLAANEIVTLALAHRAQVVIEDLTAITQGPQHKRPKGRRRTGFARVLNRAQYQKLAAILEYKLNAAGLPAPVTIHPAYTSQTCNHCGHRDPKNRASQAAFKCVACGHTAHADDNAASNIACKHLWWNTVKAKAKGKKLKDLPHLQFGYWLGQRYS